MQPQLSQETQVKPGSAKTGGFKQSECFEPAAGPPPSPGQEASRYGVPILAYRISCGAAEGFARRGKQPRRQACPPAQLSGRRSRMG
jgi:hypothetical protein